MGGNGSATHQAKRFLAIGFVFPLLEGLKSRSVGLSADICDGSIFRRFQELTHFNNLKNGDHVCGLISIATMPKRSRSKSGQNPKRVSRTFLNSPPNKRATIPRSCKINALSENLKQFEDALSIYERSRPKLHMAASQIKTPKEKKKKKIEKDEMSSVSGDELDVVFDLQEDKKNRVYEVITVMSDDETPNKITYEKLYAEDPDQKKVLEAPPEVEKKENNLLLSTDLLGELVKETNLLKRKEEKENLENAPKITKEVVTTISQSVETLDSDDDIVCVAVLEPKSKSEQKKTQIEEIFLSSDSETEIVPNKVPPIKVKIPPTNYPFYTPSAYPSSYYTTSRPWLQGPGYKKTSYLSNKWSRRKRSDSDSLSDWDSCSKSSSPNPFSDESTSSSKSAEEPSSSSEKSPSSPQLAFSSSDENSLNSPLRQNEENEPDFFPWLDRDENLKEMKNEIRLEEFTPFGKSVHEGKVSVEPNTTLTFKVMSYNVLAQSMLESHLYLYKDTDRKDLTWMRRWNLLFKEIKEESPDILCLQEVEHAHLTTQFYKILDLGYKWIYKKRTNSYHDGEAVFFRMSVFEEDARSSVEFYQPGVSVLDRDNVGIVLRLKLKSFPRQAIVVANTHLLFNPKRSDVKLAQVQVLLAEIDRLAYNKDGMTYYPVILTGDFNLRPNNGVYKLVAEGELMYEGMSRSTMAPCDDFNVLPKTLLPQRLGITDTCQHVSVLEARVKGEESNKTRLYHSSENENPDQPFNYSEDSAKDDRFESGTLHHAFNFKSVYEHKKEDEQKEGSTCHDNDFVTVDYVFYSAPKNSSTTEGGLHLLSRLRLPTQDEFNRHIRHLPNAAYGSDHLPLVAKFLLRLHWTNLPALKSGLVASNMK